jgi:hypothetical protein
MDFLNPLNRNRFFKAAKCLRCMVKGGYDMKDRYRMKNRAILFLALVFLIFTATRFGKEIDKWTNKTFDMKRYSLKRVYAPDETRIKEFFPIGFSKDGWFAYIDTLDTAEGVEPYDSNSQRLKPSDYKIDMINIECSHDCVSDAPSFKGDKCYCKYGVSAEILEKYKVQPLSNPVHGSFPAKLLGDVYDLELVYKERAIISERLSRAREVGPEYPETEIYLVSKKSGRKRIGSINHNHSGIYPGVRPAGWLKNPFSDSIIVLVLCGTDVYFYGSNCHPAGFFFKPFGANLKEGFKRGL